MHFQISNSVLIMVGERKDELGGSVYYSISGELGANVPQPDLEEVKNQIFALTDCIDNEFVLSCHDIADGGVASRCLTASAELPFAAAAVLQPRTLLIHDVRVLDAAHQLKSRVTMVSGCVCLLEKAIIE